MGKFKEMSKRTSKEPADVKYTTTDRGFQLIEFKDKYETECSIQESSLATEQALWLGQNTAGSEPSRMHLDRKQVKWLVGRLKHWLKEGELHSAGWHHCSGGGK